MCVGESALGDSSQPGTLVGPAASLIQARDAAPGEAARCISGCAATWTPEFPIPTALTPPQPHFRMLHKSFVFLGEAVLQKLAFNERVAWNSFCFQKLSSWGAICL